MDEEILKWIADYDNGVISGEDLSCLQAWLSESTDHRVAFEEQLRIHEDVRTLYFLEHSDAEEAWRQLQGHFAPKRKSRVRLVRWSVAASLLLLVGSASLLLWQHNKERVPVYTYSDTVLPGAPKAILSMADGRKVNLEEGRMQNLEEKDGTRLHTTGGNTLVYVPVEAQKETVFHTIEVPVGGEYNLRLSDGSRVWLNSATTMRYPVTFSGNVREVYVQGEAFFEVSKDVNRPFLVHSGAVEVKVLGTEFNFSAYPEDPHCVTTLKSGQVELSYGSRQVKLLPGRQAVLTKEDSTLAVKEVDPSLYMAWIKGVFEFENLSLQRIGVQLARWYGVKFVFTEPSLAERYFTGGVKRYNTLRESLNYIEHTTDVHFEIVEKNVFVTSRKLRNGK